MLGKPCLWEHTARMWGVWEGGSSRLTCRIQNLTLRLVSIRGNSGQSWHLPPQVAIDLMDAEVTDNAMIAKLVAQGRHWATSDPT